MILYRKKLFLIILTSVLLGISFWFGVVLFRRISINDEEEHIPGTFEPIILQGEVVDESGFTRRENVVVQETDEEGEATQAQIKGRVVDLSLGRMLVEAADKNYELGFGEKGVYLRCMPEKVVAVGAPEGMDSEEIFIDLSRATDRGELVSGGDLFRYINLGDMVTVRFLADKDKTLMVDMILGYGCSL